MWALKRWILLSFPKPRISAQYLLSLFLHFLPRKMFFLRISSLRIFLRFIDSHATHHRTLQLAYFRLTNSSSGFLFCCWGVCSRMNKRSTSFSYDGSLNIKVMSHSRRCFWLAQRRTRRNRKEIAKLLGENDIIINDRRN